MLILLVGSTTKIDSIICQASLEIDTGYLKFLLRINVCRFCSELALNGTVPWSIVYRSTPKLQMSTKIHGTSLQL